MTGPVPRKEVVCRLAYSAVAPIFALGKVIWLGHKMARTVPSKTEACVEKAIVFDGRKQKTMKKVRRKLLREMGWTALEIIPIVGTVGRQLRDRHVKAKYQGERCAATVSGCNIQNIVIGEATMHTVVLIQRLKSEAKGNTFDRKTNVAYDEEVSGIDHQRIAEERARLRVHRHAQQFGNPDARSPTEFNIDLILDNDSRLLPSHKLDGALLQIDMEEKIIQAKFSTYNVYDKGPLQPGTLLDPRFDDIEDDDAASCPRNDLTAEQIKSDARYATYLQRCFNCEPSMANPAGAVRTTCNL